MIYSHSNCKHQVEQTTQTKLILMMETVHVLMLGVQYKWCVKLDEMMSEDGNHCKHFLIGCCWLEFS